MLCTCLLKVTIALGAPTCLHFVTTITGNVDGVDVECTLCISVTFMEVS